MKSRREARQSAGIFLERAAARNVTVHGFRDGFLPHHWAEVKDVCERLKREISRTSSSPITVTTCTGPSHRFRIVLEHLPRPPDPGIRNPKFDETWRAQCVHALDEGLCKAKTGAILRSYRSQASRTWFSEETFMSLMRLRGIEANAPGKYAEASTAQADLA